MGIELETYYAAGVKCPGCVLSLSLVGTRQDLLTCQNPGCRFKGQTFHRPKVMIQLAETDDKAA